MEPNPWSGKDLGMKQTSFASAEYAGKKRRTRRGKTLDENVKPSP